MIDLKQIQNKKINEQSTIFRVSVTFNKDTYNISGYTLNDYYRIYVEFDGMFEFFSTIEGLFNYLDYPMNYFDDRKFILSNNDNKNNKNIKNFQLYDTKINEDFKTQFTINIKYRQNATWQGVAQFNDTNEQHKFTSELELINILLNKIK